MQLMPLAEARLTAGDPVKNARALLRYALPIKNESARRIQVCMWQPCMSTPVLYHHHWMHGWDVGIGLNIKSSELAVINVHHHVTAAWGCVHLRLQDVAIIK